MSYVTENAYQADIPRYKSWACENFCPILCSYWHGFCMGNIRLEAFSNDLRKLENVLNRSFSQSYIVLSLTCV